MAICMGNWGKNPIYRGYDVYNPTYNWWRGPPCIQPKLFLQLRPWKEWTKNYTKAMEQQHNHSSALHALNKIM